MRHGGVPQNIRLMGCRVRLPVGIAVCQIASTVCQMGGCSFGGVVPPSSGHRRPLSARRFFSRTCTPPGLITWPRYSTSS